MPHPFKDELDAIYKKEDESNYLQLFITDYANLYVAKVIAISQDDCYDLHQITIKMKILRLRAGL